MIELIVCAVVAGLFGGVIGYSASVGRAEATKKLPEPKKVKK